MSDVVYAVHTSACTYLLDDGGVCQWVLSRLGMAADDRCVGAQFVACLDPAQVGQLIGELRPGASALFVRTEEGRFVLLRTKPIEVVEMKGESVHPPPPDDAFDEAAEAYEAPFEAEASVEIPVHVDLHQDPCRSPHVDPYAEVGAEETASLPPIGEEAHARIVAAARTAWQEPEAPRPLPAPPDIPSRWMTDRQEQHRPGGARALPPIPRVPVAPRSELNFHEHAPLVDDLALTRPDPASVEKGRVARLARDAREAVSVALQPAIPTWVSHAGAGSGFRVEPPPPGHAGGAPAARSFDARLTGERLELADDDVVEISAEELSSEITITNPLFRPSTRGAAAPNVASHQRGKLLR